MPVRGKTALKDLLGELPLTAEMYWHLRHGGKPVDLNFSLDHLKAHLPDWVAQATQAARHAPSGKQLFVFTTLRYWTQHTCLLSLALAGLGHRVTLAYLPYATWKKPFHRFDLRRQNLYVQEVLRPIEPLVKLLPMVDMRAAAQTLPEDLQRGVEAVAYRDTQYSLQVEEVDTESDLYRMRLERNTDAARAALAWMQERPPDTVIVPNGSILEFGAVFRTGRFLGRPVVTYEFGEQRKRIWLARNDEVMRQNTDALWVARKDGSLTAAQKDRVETLFAARQDASLWKNFARRWQGVPSAGGARVRRSLGLDSRPIALLATNVIGDSLTLGRQVFSESMTEWLQETVRYFAGRQDLQLLIRIHPGEQYKKGPSVTEVVHRAAPTMPDHLHIIAADAPVNTYDLFEIADLGLVYTTTVGLEMVMSGRPVIVAGQTHYRNKGLTLDPDSWNAYRELLDRVFADLEGHRPTEAQVKDAWHYAYRFFFEFPRPFPWQLLHMWEELEEWPLDRTLSADGQAFFGNTFQFLAGEPIDWQAIT